ncbi:hybrid sensor histidine kinase/response regulator [Paraburkholderia kururiensis]|uniref:histidine kinase n=1 Tax=Paraburkholderia kururiensis TaxID=984307 RepID=A0ABZ0WKE0_9BURK|nr:hybrid sensor histidine kinase/response regulator [Paraburkholderia kururiensis]WQD77827.1 hybrid sensor histidine kinase/response regulator [Paraburkholderia kururiensis]
MRANPVQQAVDEDQVRVLYAQDPIAFFTHWFSLGTLVAIYWSERPHGSVPSSRLFMAWMVFYSAANVAGLALWLWHRYAAGALSARGWIVLHALRGVLLYSAPGLSIWFAFHSTQADLPVLHTVMLVTLAAGVFMSNGFDFLNFSTSIPFLLLPSIALHFSAHTFDRTILAIVLAFFFCAINVYATSYRRLFRRVVEARVDQQRLAESLAQQKLLVEEASLAKTRFFAAASHDLRQPLHAIGLLAASLNDSGDATGTGTGTADRVSDAPHAHANPDAAAQRERTARHIVHNVEALNQLFNQVLDLARLESGVTQVIRLHFRLAELFERVGNQYWPQAAAKGLALRIAPTQAVLYDDPVLLERVLGNLLSNAIRYTEEGAIWMGFRRAGRPDGGYIEVRDSGIGIAAEEQQRIFDEFYQVANPARDARQGHGLGLPTVKRLIDLLGSELQLRSAPQRGSVFRFAVREGDASRIVTSLDDTVTAGAAPEGRRVLCIDDEPAILAGLESLLKRWGCEVRGVRNEHEAARQIEAGFAPDAVLCDYQLADHRTGAQALAAVREALHRAGVVDPVTLLITGDMASSELHALAAQGIPVLHKPVTPARLRRTLQTLWQERQERQARETPTLTASCLPPAIH